jgi:dynactin complex subunit
MGMEEMKSYCCFYVGQRVLFLTSNNNERGIVKYVGAVEGYEGAWVGVEWDSGQG